jgi:hypothetical protein
VAVEIGESQPRLYFFVKNLNALLKQDESEFSVLEIFKEAKYK